MFCCFFRHTSVTRHSAVFKPPHLVPTSSDCLVRIFPCEDAWQNFCQQEGNEDALQKLRKLNHTSGGAPNVSLVGMSLSGPFSQGAADSLTRMLKIKFPTPISSGSLSYLPARRRWMDWHMQNIQLNMLESIGASVALGIRL
jgi:hypothetical protein